MSIGEGRAAQEEKKEKKRKECIVSKTEQTYVEYRLGLRPAGVCVLLAKRNELFGEALRFLGFVPGRLDGFVRDERGDEVAEEGLPVRGGAVQVPVFHGAAGHCEMRWGAGKVRWMGRRGCFNGLLRGRGWVFGLR